MTNLFICQPGGCNYKLWESALNKAMIKRARIKKLISVIVWPLSLFLYFTAKIIAVKKSDKMVNVVFLSYIVLYLRLYKVRGDALLKDGPDDDQEERRRRTLVQPDNNLIFCDIIGCYLCSDQSSDQFCHFSHSSTLKTRHTSLNQLQTSDCWGPKLNPVKRAGFDDIVATCWGSPEPTFCR